MQPSISETTKDSELLQKDLEKLKIILERYEARRDKLIDQIAVEKVELNKRSKNGCLPL
jgi:kinetochore protein NDC80